MSMPVVLVTGGYDHKIRFWDATSGSCTKSISFGESQVNCIQVSSDKSLLAAGGNPIIQLFDVNAIDEKPLITYDGHSNNVTNVGFQRDSKWLYSSSEDGTVRVWDTRSNTNSRKYDCGAPVNTVCLHPNQAELISGDQNGVIKVWDLTADKCREEVTPLTEIPIRSLSMVRHFGCIVYRVGLLSWMRCALIAHTFISFTDRAVFSTFSQAYDGSFLAAGSHKGRVFIYAPDGEKVR
jgi:G protein beta subunit-like protein